MPDAKFCDDHTHTCERVTKVETRLDANETRLEDLEKTARDFRSWGVRLLVALLFVSGAGSALGPTVRDAFHTVIAGMVK